MLVRMLTLLTGETIMISMLFLQLRIKLLVDHAGLFPPLVQLKVQMLSIIESLSPILNNNSFPAPRLIMLAMVEAWIMLLHMFIQIHSSSKVRISTSLDKGMFQLALMTNPKELVLFIDTSISDQV